MLQGDYPHGALPSEASLMLTYAASRAVVRDALGLLGSEGIISRLPSAGTFVVATKLSHRYDTVHGVEPVKGAYLRRAAEPVKNEMLSMRVTRAPGIVAHRLGLDVGAECLVAEYATQLGDTPYSLSISYLPAKYADALSDGDADFTVDWYGFLESAGITVGSSEQSVEAIIADEPVADLLEIKVGAPLLLFERLLRDDTGMPIDYGFVRVRGDRISLFTHLPRRRKE